MLTIVFLESKRSGSSRAAIQAAHRLSLYTVLISSDPKFQDRYEQDSDIHRFCWMESLAEDTVLETLKQFEVHGCQYLGIISLVDPYVSLAAKIAEQFNCNRLQIRALEILENKQLTRETFKDAHYSIPFELITDSNQMPTFPYPLMLKHPASTGSKGVYLVQSFEQWHSILSKLQKDYSFVISEHSPIICEQFVSGPQMLFEFYIENRKPYLIAAVEQHCMEPSMIIDRYDLQVNEQAHWKKSIVPIIQDVLERINFTDGYAHFEFRRSENAWKLIECNPRIAGTSMNQLILAAFGIDWTEQMIRFHCGWPLELVSKKQRNVCVVSLIADVAGTLEKVSGQRRARQSPGVEAVHVRPKKGSWIQPPEHMGHRLGYVIASAEKMQDAQSFARLAADKITFHV